MDLCADGGPHAYHPNDAKETNVNKLQGLDYLANATVDPLNFNSDDLTKNTWQAVVTSDAARHHPIRQSKSDPAEGFFVAMTALRISGYSSMQQRCYVNAETVPYIVRRPEDPFALSDYAFVLDVKTGKGSFAICAENGGTSHV